MRSDRPITYHYIYEEARLIHRDAARTYWSAQTHTPPDQGTSNSGGAEQHAFNYPKFGQRGNAADYTIPSLLEKCPWRTDLEPRR